MGNPYSYTVFHGSEEEALCRYAVWNRRSMFCSFSENDAGPEHQEPPYKVEDAEVPYEELYMHLRRISEIKFPAICIPDNASICFDVDSTGFEFFSQDDPPAGIHFQWCHSTPQEWKPLIKEIESLLEFLKNCFK